MKYFSPSTIHIWTSENFNRYLHRLAKELVLFIPIFLLALIALNLKIPKDSFEILKENVQINQLDSNSHLLLAKKFVSANQFSQAENELTQRSGSHSEQLKKIAVLKNEPARIQALVLLWQDRTNKNPNYRDGYLKLAILNWKLYRPFDSLKFLSLARSVDPNNNKLNIFEDSLK